MSEPSPAHPNEARRGPGGRRRTAAILVLSASLLAACGILDLGPFVDFDDFDPLPSLRTLPFEEVEVRGDIVYWELRQSFDSNDPEPDPVTASGGAATRDDLDPTLLAAFDSAQAWTGFAPSCLPGGCFSYVATVDTAGNVELWESAARIQALLSPIETLTEAALLTFAHGYRWFVPIENGAYRMVGDAWEIVAIELVRACDPVQEDRVLLRIGADGGLTPLKREIYQKENGVCI